MSGSQTTAGIPAVAAAVGYDTETFGPAINVGTTANPTTSYPEITGDVNMVPYTFTGTSWKNIGETNSNGAATLNGTGEAFGNGLATAEVTPAGQTLQGVAFGGGGYFQVTMAGNGPMSFWMNDAETMNGVSNGTGTDSADSWIEADIAEFDSPGAYGFTIHNWYGPVGSGDVINANENGASPAGANYSEPNTYGMLWVPATATMQGYAKFYFNGVQVGNTINWNQYVPGESAAQNPFAVMDELHMVPILGAGSGSTVTFSNLEVWQASASNDIGTGVTASPTPTPTPTPTASPSSNEITTTSGGTLTDGSGNKWTLTSAGVVDENGTAVPGGSGTSAVAIVSDVIYGQDGASKSWYTYSPTGQAWTSSAAPVLMPTPTPAPTPTPVPTPTPTPTPKALTTTSGGTLTDSSGNKWTLTSAGVVDENGTAIPGGSGTSAVAIVSDVIYGQDSASKSWYTYSPTNQTWTSSAAPVLTPTPTPTASPNDTVVKLGSTAAIVDAGNNKWTITAGGRVAVNGSADTTTANVTELTYVNGTIWQENASDLWWSKTSPTASWAPGSGTATSPLPNSVTIAATQTSATVGWDKVSVNATSGNHLVFIGGTGDTVNLSGGTNTITDTGSGNTYVIPAAGKGYDSFSTNVLVSGDTLDLRTALAATDWNGAAPALANYLTVADTSQGIVLSIKATSAGAAGGIATISGASGTMLAGLLAHAVT
jgi:hypothetical protein